MRFRLPLALLAAFAATAASAPPVDLYAKRFGVTSPKRATTLIVVLHGDTPTPGYQYDFARAAAAAVPGSLAVALLRPGYEDPAGRRSPGVRGTATGDDYTADRIAAVAESIRKLAKRYRSARIILVGHAGGAAVAADLAGSQPGLIDGMILVACPCKLPEWRRHMKTAQPASGWDRPSASLDPIMLVGGIPSKLRTAVLVGSDDRTTPVDFSRAYAEALTLRGIATDYRIVPGKGHELLGDAEVIGALQRMAAALPRKR